MKPISHRLFKDRDRSLEDRLKRLFKGGFTAIDIAEPLVCFDGDKSANEVLSILDQRKIAVAGVLDQEVFLGIIGKRPPVDGRCREVVQAVKAAYMLDHSASYQDVIEVLDRSEVCLITFLGQVAGVIQRKDVTKPSVRMWLFGLITMAEMILSSMLERHYPNGSWQAELPEARLDKARALLAERRRRGQELELQDCLYFVDKASILTKNPAIREELGVETRKEAKQAISKYESLRNSLAHTQDIVVYDWDAIVQITRSLDRTLSRF